MKKLMMMALAALVLNACNSNSEKKNAVEKMITSDNPLMTAEGIDKFNAYIDYLNEKNRVYTILDRYLDDVDKTGKSTTRDGGIPISTITLYPIKKLSEKVGAEPSFGQLDTDAKALIEAYESLEKKVKQLDDYNKIKEYMSDDYAKAKELYPQIEADYKKFEALDILVERGIAEVQQKVRDAELKNFKEMGYEISYSKSIFLESSRDLLNYVSEKDINTMQELDKEKVKTLINKMSADFTLFNEKAEDQKLLEKEFGPNNQYKLDSFKRSAQTYIAQSRTLQELLNSPAKMKEALHTFTFHRGMIVPDGTPDKILTAFDSMIRDSNNIM